MHGQSPASPEGGRYLSRVGGGVVALGQTGERHPWISFFIQRYIPRLADGPNYMYMHMIVMGRAVVRRVYDLRQGHPNRAP